MRWRRIFGVFLLLVGLLLAVLLSANVPFVKVNRFPIDNPVEVPPLGEPSSFYNTTLEPLGKEDYRVRVSISSYNQPIQVDFWAVNETGLGILAESLSYGELLKDRYYANEPPFANIKAHAREINITIQRQFDLVNLDHNGTYCLVLLNFFDNPQNVSVTVEEQYIESFRPLLEPNPVNIAITVIVFIASLYLIVADPKRSVRRAKRHGQKT